MLEQTVFQLFATRPTSAATRDPAATWWRASCEATTIRAPFSRRSPPRPGAYNGFNLRAGDGAALWYFGSREGEARPIGPGIHALSNHLLDEPWPKVRRAREAMAADVAGDAGALFAMLGDTTPGADAELPDTGVGLAWERRLSPALITGPDYGTRASTVVRLASHGESQFEEGTRGPAGEVTGTVVHALPPGA